MKLFLSILKYDDLADLESFTHLISDKQFEKTIKTDIA